MKTFISLLRGINVSEQNRLRMPELKGLYESLNLVNVVTYIQSGNVVFDCKEQDPAALGRGIEAEIARSFGLALRVLLRDREQFEEIIQSNPFVNQRNEDPEKLHVTFLYEAPSEPALNHLIVPTGSVDEFWVDGREIYLFCPNGYGRTKFSNTFFEKRLDVAATTRNWKTVNAVYELTNQR
jgi:uncharacterized protein (DUF1697 family)